MDRMTAAHGSARHAGMSVRSGCDPGPAGDVGSMPQLRSREARVSARPEGRTAAADVELGGVTIRSGDSVQILWNSANRDERIFDRPDAVDLDRSPNPHIGFGTGIHRCLGLHLAKLQVRVAVEEWLDAVPTFGLGEDASVEWSVGLDRSLRALDVVW